MAPQFIQGGDSAELVLAANHLLVAHPPGYPLWIWLQFIWTHLFPLGSLFWKASVLNIFFGLGALYFLLKMASKNVLALCGVLVLGLSPLLLEASLIPDVFALHALFTAAVYFFFFREKEDFRNKENVGKESGLRQRSFLMPFLFCLGLTNQLTLVLLFPLVLWTFYESYKQPSLQRSFLKGLAGGGVLMALAYVSLFFLHVNHPFSWGSLHGFTDLWDFVLRRDYGTFRLSATSQSVSPIALLIFALKNFGVLFFLLAGVLTFQSFMRPQLLKEKRFLVGLFSTALCFLFLFLVNVAPVGAGAEVLRRFCVMPLVGMTALTVVGFRDFKADRKFRFILLCLFAGVSVFLLTKSKGFWNLRNDSMIENYAKNVLRFSPQKKPQVFLTQLDTSYFALRYVQLQFGAAKDSVVISPSLLMHPWYVEKVRQVLPDFHLKNESRIFAERSFKQEDDLITPNLPQEDFIVFQGYGDGHRYQTTFLKLGRLLREGQGVSFAETSLNEDVSFPSCLFEKSTPHFYSKKFLCAQYAHYYLARGMNRYTQGESAQAMADWKAALQKVPYAFPALMNLCQISSKQIGPQCSPEHMQQIKKESQGYF
jgi:hypothetical protein